MRSFCTAVPVANFDPRAWSGRNGVGINPFALLSSVQMTAAPGAAGTVVTVSIDRLRVLAIWPLKMALVTFIAPSSPPWPVVPLRWAYSLTHFEVEEELRSW